MSKNDDIWIVMVSSHQCPYRDKQTKLCARITPNRPCVKNTCPERIKRLDAEGL
jgi:hypothetical protein